MVGMHEEFHDTINLAKRKPRRLTGTPAASFCFWTCFGIVSTTLYFMLISKNFKWTRGVRERTLLQSLPDEHEELRKLAFLDPCIRSALVNLEKRHMKEEDSLQPADVSPAMWSE